MKTFVKALAPVLRPTRAALWLLFLLALNSLSQPVFAQKKEHPILRTTQAGIDSTQGYWELKTLVDTRMTVIQFFAPDRQLLYQESLPEKWVKPTRHNRRQFDRLLKELLAHRLVTTRIRTETLPMLLPEPRLPISESGSNRDHNASAEATPCTINAFVNELGTLRLLIDTPLRHRYKIELTDEHGVLKYQEFNNLAHYRRRFNISALGSGSYSLLVRIDGQDVRYSLNNGLVMRSYQLVPLAVNQR